MKDWLDFEYSNKSVTAHGVMSLTKRFLDRTEIINKINSLGLVEPGSNAGYSVSEMFVKLGRKEILKMYVNLKKRVWMDGLFLNSSNFK